MALFVPFIVMDDVILKYFNDGFPYFEIVGLLTHAHDFRSG